MLSKVVATLAALALPSEALKVDTDKNTVLHHERGPIIEGKKLDLVNNVYDMGLLGYYPDYTSEEQPDEPINMLSKNSYPCLFKIGNSFYDFTPFKLASNVWPAFWANETQILPDMSNPDPNFETSLDFSYQYQFGFCQQMKEAANSTCNTEAYAIGAPFNGTQLVEDDEDYTMQPPFTCQPYSGSTSEAIEATQISQDITNTTSNETTTYTGVQIKYSGGICQHTGGPATFSIRAWCNDSIPILETEFNGTAMGDDVCNPYVEIHSSIGGCDLFSNSMIWEYMAYAEPYIGGIAIVGGIVLCFFGLKLVKPSICFAGFLTSIFLAILFFYAIYATSVEELSTFYYWIAGGAVIGLILGWLLSHFVKVGAAILAGWGGFMIGLILNEAFLYTFEYVWVFWTANVVCMLVCAGLTFKLFDFMMIFSTCVLGSYGLIRGVSCYAGHYYNEFVVVQLLKSGAIDQIDPYYWGYVGGFVVFAVIGAWYQNRQKPKAETTKHPYYS